MEILTELNCLLAKESCLQVNDRYARRSSVFIKMTSDDGLI
jgi:hypothetical protein